MIYDEHFKCVVTFRRVCERIDCRLFLVGFFASAVEFVEAFIPFFHY